MRATDNCFSASRGGVRSPPPSWQPEQRFWYTSAPETAAPAGTAQIIKPSIGIAERVSTRSILLPRDCSLGESLLEFRQAGFQVVRHWNHGAEARQVQN